MATTTPERKFPVGTMGEGPNAQLYTAPQLPPRPPGQTLTPYALKYGVSPTREKYNPQVNPQYPGLLKSIFTPVNITGLVPVEDRLPIAKTLDLQRIRMKGFVSSSVIEGEFVSDRALRPSDITNPIYPLLGREHWTMLPGQMVIPLTDATGVQNGFWEGSNDVAWNALQPALKLASLILTNIHHHPWFDALMLGREEPVPPNRFPSPVILQNPSANPQRHKIFRLREPLPNNAAECEVARKELETWPALRDITLGFISNYTRYNGALNLRGQVNLGYATWNPMINSIAIFIGYERVATLLRTDLNDADRLCLQFNIANTIVHEMIHAYGLAKRHRQQVAAGGSIAYPVMLEPYLEDEICAELGSSLESAVWGGVLVNLTAASEGYGLSYGFGIMRCPQPQLTSMPVLIDPPLPALDFFRPIQVSYYENVHQAAFWDFHVRSFSSIKPGPIIINGQFRDAVAVRAVGVKGPWMLVNDVNDYHQVILPVTTAAATLNQILAMTPAHRLAYAAAKKSQEVFESILTLLQERKRQTEALWDQAEILARVNILQGGYNTAQGLERLITLFEELLKTALLIMTSLDKLLSTSAQRGTCLTDMQQFTRGLRSFIIEFGRTGYTAIDQRFTVASAAVQGIHELLTVDPENPNGLPNSQERALAVQDEDAYGQMAKNAEIAYVAGDSQTALNLCSEVASAMGASLLTKSFARILIAYNDGVELEDRLAAAERAVETLKASIPPTGRDAEQKQVLQLGELILDRLVSQSQAQAPAGGPSYV